MNIYLNNKLYLILPDDHDVRDAFNIVIMLMRVHGLPCRVEALWR
jgi:hypothetical protein